MYKIFLLSNHREDFSIQLDYMVGWPLASEQEALDIFNQMVQETWKGHIVAVLDASRRKWITSAHLGKIKPDLTSQLNKMKFALREICD